MTMSTATTMPSTSWRVRPNSEGTITIRGREMESVIALNGVEMPTPAAVSGLVEEVQDTICSEITEIAELAAAIKAKANALLPIIFDYCVTLEDIDSIYYNDVQPDSEESMSFYGDDWAIYDAGICIGGIDHALIELEDDLKRALHDIECGNLMRVIDSGEYLIPDEVEDTMKALAAI